MSWMDSWSRPKKSAVTPPPYYLTPGLENTPYCHSCGRVISNRKSESAKAKTTPVKYCSDRCRNSKPGQVDRRIESTFVALLDGADASQLAAHPERLAADAIPPAPQSQAPKKKKYVKGDPRITVMCQDVEEIIFGNRHDPEKTHGRKKNKAKRTLGSDDDGNGSDEDYGRVRVDDARGDIGSGSNTAAGEHSADISEAEGNISDGGTLSETGSMGSSGGVALPDRPKSSVSAAAETNQPDPALTDSSGKHSSQPPQDDEGAPKATVLSDHKNFGAGKTRPAQIESEVNFSVGGERGWAEKLEETPEMLAKRREGQKRAEERESVRCAARRLCAFGWAIKTEEVTQKEREGESKVGRRKGKKGHGDIADDHETNKGEGVAKEKMKKCEALMNSIVVESSLAKGEFGIRWREEQDF